MAGPGYGGFFLKGLAGGLQTGVNLGIQIQEMKWQKDQRKKLKEKEEKIEEGMLSFGNLIRQYGADNVYSDDEIMQLNTVLMASVAEVQAVYGDALNNIQTMNKRKLEEDFQLLDLLIKSTDDLDPKDVQGIFDTAKGWFKTDKAKNYFTAFEEIHRKRYEATQARPVTEVFTSAEALREKYPKAEVKYTDEGYVPIFKEIAEPKAPAITDYNSAWNHLNKFRNLDPSQFEKYKSGFQSRFPNIDMSGITQESLVKPEPTPAPTSTENVRKAIREADTIEDARRIHKNYADKYDETALDIDDVDRFWAEGQTVYLNNIKTAIGNIIDEKGWLKKGTITSAEVGLEFEGEQSVEEIYKILKEEYMKYRDMLEKMGVDVTQFPKLKSLEEIEKVGFGEGFWRLGKQRGQYKSIYY